MTSRKTLSGFQLSTYPRVTNQIFNTLIIRIMAYNSRHSIFLQDNDKQKLKFIKSLFDEDGICFVIKDETIYQYDGELENLYEFQDGSLSSDEDIIHYQTELQKMTICWKDGRQEP